MNARSKAGNRTPSKPLLLWAVDPFGQSLKLQREAGWALRALGGRWKFEIQPVYVAAHPLPHLPGEVTEELHTRIRAKALEDFEEVRRGIRLNPVFPLAVLRAERGSVSSRVDALLEYAAECGAGMIVATTRARSGPARWILGSFAETLSLRSSIPVLTVNPDWKPLPSFKDILYATDFSEVSHQGFRRLLDFAAETGARVHLYSKFVIEPALYWDFAYATTTYYEEWRAELLQTSEASAREWTNEALKRGVRCGWEIDRKPGASAAQAILARSAKHPGMIAMAGQSGPIEANLLGSVTRQVMRAARVPVLVLHPEPKAVGRDIPRDRSVDRKEPPYAVF